MKTLRIFAFGALLIGLAPTPPASAHDPKARFGGAIVMTATYHVEMVVKDGQVDVYLTGHDDKPVSAKGRKGVAILLAGGKNVRVPLEPVGTERLSGKVTEALPSGSKGVVQIIEPTGGTIQARFN
jgi:hypothetical protein